MSTLDSLREEIDAIDDQLVELLCARWSVLERVAHLKARSGCAGYDPERERAIAARLAERLTSYDDETRGDVLRVMGLVVERGRSYVLRRVRVIRRT